MHSRVTTDNNKRCTFHKAGRMDLECFHRKETITEEINSLNCFKRCYSISTCIKTPRGPINMYNFYVFQCQLENKIYNTLIIIIIIT
jgi:hypothetical protein